MLIFAKTSRFE